MGMGGRERKGVRQKQEERGKCVRGVRDDGRTGGDSERGGRKEKMQEIKEGEREEGRK